MADYIPTEWQQGDTKYSRSEYQDGEANVHKDLIRKNIGKTIVTYNEVHEKVRTLPKTKLIKDQVNKDRGFKIDKTGASVQMKIKNDHLNSENTRWIPGYSMGTKFIQEPNKQYNEVIPKNTIIRSHVESEKKKIINGLRGIDEIIPSKQLNKNPLISSNREITNYTPVHSIVQPVIRVYNMP